MSAAEDWIFSGMREVDFAGNRKSVISAVGAPLEKVSFRLCVFS